MFGAFAHVALLIVLLGCMALHELGHAMMVRARGHKPTLIMLSFVGLTFFEAKGARPSDEFWIAIAGPGVNLAIGLLLSPFILLALGSRADHTLLSQASLSTLFGFLAALSVLNLVMGFGNLLPLWPADGSRAVRGFMARRHGFIKGTKRAVEISHGLWLVIGGLALGVVSAGSWLKGERPGASALGMVSLYAPVVLILAAMGIYYGWLEERRVARIGEERAREDVGPPPEFAPGRAKAPLEAEKVDEPGIGDKLKAGVTAGKAVWQVGKISGKGGWWAVKTVLGRMLGGKGDK
jgi:Zn-dependent protease